MHYVCMLQSCMPCQFLTNGIFWTFMETVYAAYNMLHFSSVMYWYIETEFREISKFSFSSRNCHFWDNITKMITRMNFQISANLFNLWFLKFFKKIAIIGMVNSTSNLEFTLHMFLCISVKNGEKMELRLAIY